MWCRYKFIGSWFCGRIEDSHCMSSLECYCKCPYPSVFLFRAPSYWIVPVKVHSSVVSLVCSLSSSIPQSLQPHPSIICDSSPTSYTESHWILRIGLTVHGDELLQMSSGLFFPINIIFSAFILKSSIRDIRSDCKIY